jgi:hypothetical protein
MRQDAAGRGKMLDLKDIPIEKMLIDRNWFRKRTFDAWLAGQGRKIKAARPGPVYDACVAYVRTLIDQARSDVHHETKKRVEAFLLRHALTAEQIAECELRAVSQIRAAKRGFPPKFTQEAWESQIASIRAEIQAGLDNPTEQA